eukprot:IDg9169t1
MSECVQNEDSFYAQYLGISRSLLAAYPIPSSTGTTPADLPDSLEVKETMKDMLPPSPNVFTEDYFSRPTYPIKILLLISQFYGFSEIDDEFQSQLLLSSNEKKHKCIMNQIWFAHLLGFDSSTTRSVIDKFKNIRSILTHRSAGAPSVSTVTGTAGTAGPAYTATPARELAVQSASGPAPGLPAVESQGTQGHQLRTEDHSDPLGSYIPLHRRNNPSSGLQVAAEDTRKATYVHQHFSQTKFTGEMSQSIIMHLRDYENCARQHRLSPTQKADYLVNSLGGTARNFMLSIFVPGMTFDDTSSLMLREYDSDSRQLQVQSSLKGLKLGSFMTSQSIFTESKGLNKIV